MGIYANDVQKLYIAYFNRPADPVGLAYWEEQITNNGGSTAAVANAFSASAEYKALYDGKSSAQIVDAIYQNLFGRSAEVDGLTYWAVRLENGTFNVGNIAVSIMVGAQNDDKKVIDNKVVVATEFTTALDTTAEILAYSGTTAAATARTFLATVGSTDDSLTAAKAAVATTVSSIASSTPANGTTFTLTTGVDTATGTGGNDTFIGDAATITTSDQVSGGAGTDTIKIYDLAAATDVPTITGVEVIELINANAPANLDLTGVTDLTTLVLDNTTDTDDYLIGASVKATVKNMVNAETVTLTSTATDTAADLTVENLDVAGAGTVTVNFDGASITTVNLTSSGSNTNNLTFASTGSETTVNVAGSTAMTLVNAATTITTFNAASNTGGVTFDMSSATGTNQTLTGGSGNDSLTVDLARNITLDAGAGNDVVAFDAGTVAADLSSTAGAADSIKGGDGTDTLSMTAATADALADDTTADRAVISGFEQIRTTTDLNAASFGIDAYGVNYLQIGAATTTAAATVSGFTSGATVEYRAAADSTVAVNVGMTGATGAGTPDDLLNVKLNSDLIDQAGAADAFAVILAVDGINKLVVTTADRVNTDAATDRADGYILTLDNDNSVTQTTVSGDRELSFTSTAETAALATFNASALTGNLIVDLSTNGLTQGVVVTGGAGTNTVTGTGFADSITGGARADTITAGAGADTITGGAGADTFVFAASSSGGAPSATAFDTITDFAKASDIIDFGAQALSLSTDASSTASVGVAAINAEGIATFNAADDTLAERIAAVNAGLAAGTEATGQVAVFEFDGSSYVYVYDNTADTVAAEDVLIKLTGVTGLTDSTITGGDLTIA